MVLLSGYHTREELTMPNHDKDSLLSEILELLTREGLNGAGEALRLLLNGAMRAEESSILELVRMSEMSSVVATPMDSSLKLFTPGVVP